MRCFAVNDADCFFRIETGYECKGYFCLSYGDSDTLIEMTIEHSSARIITIECIYLGEVLHEPRLKLPDFRSNPNLISYNEAVCYDDFSRSQYPCMVNLIDDELNLIFSGTCEPKFYYVHDRVEYYYNKEFDLAYIKVGDLTADELAYLNR